MDCRHLSELLDCDRIRRRCDAAFDMQGHGNKHQFVAASSPTGPRRRSAISDPFTIPGLSTTFVMAEEEGFEPPSESPH
jgi:hypothetical protein